MRFTVCLGHYGWDVRSLIVGFCRQLAQLRIFRFSFLEDENVRVGVLPQRKKILIPGAGFGGIAGHQVRPCESQTRLSSEWTRQHETWMIQNLLILSCSLRATVQCKISRAPEVCRVIRPAELRPCHRTCHQELQLTQGVVS